MKKGNSRDRSGLTKVNKDVQESRRPEKSTNSNDSLKDFQDAIKSFTKPRQTSDDEEEKLRTPASSASAALSTLLIPSLKEEISEDLGAPIVNLVINSLMDMEYTKPGSCEFFVTRLLHRLARFSKGKKVTEQPENMKPEAESKKKQNKDAQSNANLTHLQGSCF